MHIWRSAKKTSGLLTDRKLLVFVGLVTGFTILGPFGTYEVLGLWERLIFWALIIAGVGALMNLSIVLALGGGVLTPLPRFVRIAVGAAIAAVPSVALILFFTIYLFPTPVSAQSFPFLWAQIAVVGTVAGVLEYPAPVKSGAPDEPQAPVQTTFHKRLPEGASHDLISLTVRDHYVEVTTTTGFHTILMRLTDAIDELEGLAGERLHRSHWAAAGHLKGLRRSGQKHVAILSDGRELPVSKSYVTAVETTLAKRGIAGAPPELG